MNMHSNAITDRIEIFFYSILISIMSGVNRIRARFPHQINNTNQPSINEAASTSNYVEELTESTMVNGWTYINQTVIPLVIWIIMGFATGFLIGMFVPR